MSNLQAIEETKLPAIIGKLPASDLLEAMNRLVQEDQRKYTPTAVEMNLALIEIYKKWPSMPTQDVVHFLYQSMTTGARPLNKEIYAIPFNESRKVNGQWEKFPTLQVVFSYHFFNQMAERTGLLEAIDVWSEKKREPAEDGTDRIILEATAKIYKKGSEHPTIARARYDEFCKTSKDGQPNKQWKTAPCSMTEKCAVARAMRLAFPNSLKGLYTEEELGLMMREDPSAPRPDQVKALKEFNETYRKKSKKESGSGVDERIGDNRTQVESN